MAFTDAFEVVNPLGASKKKVKIVGCYLCLGNLPPHLKSKTENLKLIFLCREKYINLYGWEVVLKKFMQDLRILESEAITISISGKDVKYYGTLVAMLGDSLGAHQIGGFIENFSTSIYLCRFCEITRELLRLGNYHVQKLRNAKNYLECCDKINTGNKSEKGIKENSTLNGLKYFHVCNPGLPPCAAHDLFEGIIVYDLMLAIKHFIEERWFSLEELNYRIDNFQFCDESKQTLPPIKIGNKLSGSASDIKRLIMIFPVIVADRVESFEDHVWMMMMHLREVCSIVCAPALSVDQAAVLQDEIHQYLDLRVDCFPEIPLRPKHHYVVHYPSLILHFGPLKHVWTLRFESKHSYFKNVVRHVKNFRNITATLSRKHEQLQCISESRCKYESRATLREIIPFEMNIFQDEKNANLALELFAAEKVHFVGDEVHFQGITYKRGMCICSGKSPYGVFLLSIEKILISKTGCDVYFYGNVMEVHYNQQVGVFELFEAEGDQPTTKGAIILPFSALLCPDPVLKTNIGSEEVYVCKYAPLDHQV